MRSDKFIIDIDDSYKGTRIFQIFPVSPGKILGTELGTGVKKWGQNSAKYYKGYFDIKPVFAKAHKLAKNSIMPKRETYKQDVGGSIPSPPTKKI